MPVPQTKCTQDKQWNSDGTNKNVFHKFGLPYLHASATEMKDGRKGTLNGTTREHVPRHRGRCRSHVLFCGLVFSFFFFFKRVRLSLSFGAMSVRSLVTGRLVRRCACVC